MSNSFTCRHCGCVNQEHVDKELYESAWEEASYGEDYLTHEGLGIIYGLTKKYSNSHIFEAIRIAWETEKVEPKLKLPYMIGILKNISKATNLPTA